MGIHKLFDRLFDWYYERSMRKYRKEHEPTASCRIPDLGQFDLVQGFWQGGIEAAGVALSVLVDANEIDANEREIPEQTVALVKAVRSDLKALDEAARLYCARLESEADRDWIERCGGLELQCLCLDLADADVDFELSYGGVEWEDATVAVAFKDMTPTGHFFAD